MASYIFENGSIFDGTSEKLITGHSVHVEGNKITKVSPEPVNGNGGTRIDLGGKTLMPGLIDAHVHVYAHEANLSLNDDTPTEHRALYAKQFMEAALLRGFTTLRDAGGAGYHLSAAAELGLIRGPRLFYSGLAISQTGGHGDFRMIDRKDVCACSYSGAISRIADGEDDVRRAVRDELRKGAHQIKIMASGGTASPSDPVWMDQYTEKELRAAVEEAARLRTYVMAHAYAPSSIRRCVENGVRSIEHGNLIDPSTAELIAQKGAFIVPTLATYNALSKLGREAGWKEAGLSKVDTVRERGLAALEICKSAGAKMGFGTDLLGSMHVYQCDEFRIRNNVLAPIDILRSATSVNGELLQAPDELGIVEAGALADLIVVDGNPLDDLSVFQNDGSKVDLVMKDGAIYKNQLQPELA